MAAGTENRVLVAGPGADWRDYTFDFDLTITPAGGRGRGSGSRERAGWIDSLAFRLATPRGERTYLGSKYGRVPAAGPRSSSRVISLELVVQPARRYHVRGDVAGRQVTTLIDGHVVSADSAAGFATGGVGFWAAAGDQFVVAHPRVFSTSRHRRCLRILSMAVVPLGTRALPGAPQPVLLGGAKRDRAVGVADLAIAGSSQYRAGRHPSGAHTGTRRCLRVEGSIASQERPRRYRRGPRCSPSSSTTCTPS